MLEVRKVKQLQSQLNALVNDSETLKIEIANKQREYNLKLVAINHLKDEINKINNTTNVKVSEHAIVRYFERVKGFDIAEIEKEILSDSVVKLSETLGGNGTYPNNDYSVVMKNFTVVTVK